MNTSVRSEKPVYIHSNEENASLKISEAFCHILSDSAYRYKRAVIICIGTDRATGDSLGPLVGHYLQNFYFKNVLLYGTLKDPVHARNLEKTIQKIEKIKPKPLVIAIDACLGRYKSVGCITVNKGAIKPGAGVNKELPEVGDISITGIVNFSGMMDMMTLQNTRLHVVMHMAELIAEGIQMGINKWESKEIFMLKSVNSGQEVKTVHGNSKKSSSAIWTGIAEK